MVPAAVVDETIAELVPAPRARATSSIDGGNSYYVDDIRRAKELAAEGHPLRRRRHERRRLGPRARLLPDDRRRAGGRAAPRPDLRHAGARASASAPRTPGPRGDARRPPSTATCTAGPSGAGHFVKMVHNGIEYGLMAAYAEGLNILRDANVGQATRTRSTPRRRRCATPSTTSTTSTSPTSPRSGGAAASSPRGCST